MSGGLSFSEPLWLALLPLVWLVQYLAERRGTTRLGRRGSSVRAARWLLLLALVLALAEPKRWSPVEGLTVIFAVDASHSIGAEGLAESGRYLAEAAQSLRPGDRAGTIVFGREAMVEARPREDWRPGALLARPRVDATDLEAAVSMARGLFPAGDEARLVLLTDGLETRGSIENALAGSDVSDFDVVWIPRAGRDAAETIVESVSAPEFLSESQPHRVRVLVRSSRETDAVLRLYRDGSLVTASRVHLTPGPGNLFSLEQTAPATGGPLVYRAEIEAADDAVVENNRASAVVRVRGRPRILLLDDEVSALRPLERALSGAQLSVSAGDSAALPADLLGMAAYDAIVLADAPATDFSDGQLAALRAYVHAAGGGLVMIGGPDSLGPGGYWRTPVEEALPVDLDVKDRRNYPSIGIVLCVDKSGSMAGTGRAAKIDVAKSAAAAVAAELTANDVIGVVGFDAAAKWVSPLMPGGDVGEVERRLGTLRAGGGTDAYPALELALEALDPLEVRVKHVILLTDGQLSARDHEGLAGTMAARGISVSTIAVGTDADLYTLDRIAEVGDGEFYLAPDIARVPRIFLREAFRISRSWLVEEPFQPQLQADHTALAGLDLAGMPPLEGYVVTTPKPAAQHPLSTHRADPLLSFWRYGLGKSATFSSDAKGRWAINWLRWGGYAPFWSQVVRWSVRDRDEASRLRTAVQIDEDRLRIVADYFDDDGSLINGAGLQGIVAGPDGMTVETTLRQTGPGRYGAEMEVDRPGVYLAAVTDEARRAGSTATAVLPYASEFRSIDLVPHALERLVAGGRVREVSDHAELFRHAGNQDVKRTSLVPWLLALAGLSLLGEVAARKLTFRSRAPQRAEQTASVPATPEQPGRDAEVHTARLLAVKRRKHGRGG